MSEMSGNSETDIIQKKANPRYYVKGLDKKTNFYGRNSLAYLRGEKEIKAVNVYREKVKKDIKRNHTCRNCGKELTLCKGVKVYCDIVCARQYECLHTRIKSRMLLILKRDAIDLYEDLYNTAKMELVGNGRN